MLRKTRFPILILVLLVGVFAGSPLIEVLPEPEAEPNQAIATAPLDLESEYVAVLSRVLTRTTVRTLDRGPPEIDALSVFPSRLCQVDTSICLDRPGAAPPPCPPALGGCSQNPRRFFLGLDGRR